MVKSFEIPPEIKNRYMDIKMSIDIMFMNNVAFIMTASNNPIFIISKYISISIKEVILSAMNQMKNIYYHIGFCTINKKHKPI